MRRNTRPRLAAWRLALMVVCLATGVAACAGGNGAAPTAPGATVQQAPANLPLASPGPGPRCGLSLPGPAAMNARLDACKQASYAYEDLSKLGDEYEPALPNQRVSPGVGLATFTPAWENAAESTAAGLAYAVYAFELEDYDLSGALHASWQLPPQENGAWVGLGNTARDRWDWYALDSEGIVRTTGFSGYIDAGSSRMLAVVVVLGTAPVQLARLALGSGISGIIVDTTGEAVGGAQVLLDGLDAVQAGFDGRFDIWGLAETNRLVVNFKAEGYVDTTRIYEVVAGRQRWMRVVLLPRATAVDINATAGGEFAFPGPLGGSLTLPPGALVDHHGAALMGTLKARLTFLDVTDPAQMAAAPGNFEALQLDSSAVLLHSYGIAEVHIDDGRGGEAQLAAGQTAQFKLPVPPALQATAPAATTLYSFDQAQGRWIEESACVKDGSGQFYEGSFSHFSVWNTDDPIYDITCFRIKVTDAAGHAVAGANVVYTGEGVAMAGSAFTGLDGYACLDSMHNTALSVQAMHNGAASDTAVVSTPGSIQSCGESPTSCLLLAELELREPPVAKLTAAPDSGDAPLAVAFDASASTPGDLGIASYEWDFDGPAGGYNWTATGVPSMLHTYTTPGDYYPAVRVTDSAGAFSMASVRVQVGGASARGDWWVAGHDPQHTYCSSYTGPHTAGVAWIGTQTDDSVVGSGLSQAADGTLYCGDISGRLYAFDPLDGGIKWASVAMDDRTQCTPAVAGDGTVYTIDFACKLYAFDPADGSVKWSYLLYNNHDDPLLGQDGTIFAPSVWLYAINPADQSLRWRYMGSMSGQTPAQGYNGTLYAPTMDQRLCAIHPGTGELLWQAATEDQVWTPASVARDGTVYACGRSFDGNAAVYAFLPGNGAYKWKAEFGGDRIQGESPGIGPDGNLYICDTYFGRIIALDSATGAQLWLSDHSPAYFYSCPPAIGADGVIYVGASDNKVHALSPSSGADIWESSDMGTMLQCTPLIGAGGVLYAMTSDGVLWAFDGS